MRHETMLPDSNAAIERFEPGDGDAAWRRRLTEFTPARLPHADAYRSVGPDHRSRAPRTQEISLDDLVGPIADVGGPATAEDRILALLFAYAQRVSGETRAAVDLRIGARRADAVHPLCVEVEPDAAFPAALDAVIAERSCCADEPFDPTILERDPTLAAVRAHWSAPMPVAVQLGDSAAAATARATDLAVVVDAGRRSVHLSCPAGVEDKFLDAVVSHLRTLAQSIMAAPSQPIADLEYMTAQETRAIVVAWNETAVRYPTEQTLIDRLEVAAAASSSHAALVLAGETVSYGDFNQRVNRLAHYLRSVGVERDTLVAICMERSIELVVAIWAVLKAGGAYVPLNVEDPPKRLAKLIRGSGIRHVLTQETLIGKLPRTQLLVVTVSSEADAFAPFSDENPSPAGAPEDLAYMIYTSGSTGEPKGVLVEHKAILNRILWMQDAYRLTAADRVLQKTPYTFDVSVWEFLWPLVVGATLVVAEPGGHVVPSYLARLMRTERITCVHFVPSVLRLFLNCRDLDELCLRLTFCSGEALPWDLQEKFFERLPGALHNLYGPTEAAVDVSYWECRSDRYVGRVPIGKPIANISLHVLDADLRPTAIGVPGELHIGGVGLARGYWMKPELTRERFIRNPFTGSGSDRLYKTGDIARYLPDGNIEYLGRNDHQVKINGARVELGEVESIIRAHPSVRDVVVVARTSEQGSAYLAAYLVPMHAGASDVTCDHLREFMEGRLPPHMVPREFLFHEKIPLTSSGKADRKALLRQAQQPTSSMAAA